jgi:hypothetical protein
MANNFLIQDLERGMVLTREGFIASRNADKYDHLVVETGPNDGRFYIYRINIVPMIFREKRLDL